MATTNKWIIVQIKDNYEVDFSDIKKSLSSYFEDDSDYFIPIFHEQVGSYTTKIVLYDNYVFVKDTQKNRDIVSIIYESGIFLGPLIFNREWGTVTDIDINKIKEQIQEKIKRKIEKGKKVLVLEGIFKNLIGEVVGIDHEGTRVIIQIIRKSRQIIAPVPITCIKEVD